jgi:hypothetical protein
MEPMTPLEQKGFLVTGIVLCLLLTILLNLMVWGLTRWKTPAPQVEKAPPARVSHWLIVPPPRWKLPPHQWNRLLHQCGGPQVL